MLAWQLALRVLALMSRNANSRGLTAAEIRSPRKRSDGRTLAEASLCEHLFVTAQGSASTRFRRAIERKSVINAELAAREMGRLDLEDALSLVLLYAAADDPRFDRAATRWIGRFCVEEKPSLLELQAAVSALALLRRGGGAAAEQLLVGLTTR